MSEILVDRWTLHCLNPRYGMIFSFRSCTLTLEEDHKRLLKKNCQKSYHCSEFTKDGSEGEPYVEEEQLHILLQEAVICTLG